MSSQGEKALFCSTITPLDVDFSIDVEGLRNHLNRLVAARNGLWVASGGCGEAFQFSTSECRVVYDTAVEVAQGRVPVIAVVRESRNAAAVCELASEARAAGVDGVHIYQVDGGHAMVPTEREQAAYFEEILEFVDLPVTIGIHGFAGYVPSPTFMQNLCEKYEQIESISIMSITDYPYFFELKDAVPSRIKFVCGAINVLQCFALGFDAVSMAPNNLIPWSSRHFVDSYNARDLEEASRSLRFISHVHSLCLKAPFGIAREVKSLLNAAGWGNGIVRPPLESRCLDADYVQEQLNQLRKLGVIEAEAKFESLMA
ncbi:dihydrodipicolinate synthase family protein [Streptomyces sp. NPDC001982]|uniref:dihydrodipicolinate synthase family protein n=1 Tax=Streptomyces sp. NPDC001982 TaxID=3154405 RepID=UPI00331C7C0A